ncbi:MAG: pilus assembly protein N-terminal domain-containing protein [Litorimonas sp.]
MRSLTFTAAIFAATLVSSPALGQSRPVDNYSIELNKTEIVRLPRAASAVLIGNPDIADVSVHSVDTIFVVGRGYGQTNLIILDQTGNTMLETDLNVVHTLPKDGVRLFNAKSRETYSCITYCQPSPVLGDDPSFIGNNTNSQPDLDPLSAFFQAATSQINGPQEPVVVSGANNSDFNNNDNLN